MFIDKMIIGSILGFIVGVICMFALALYLSNKSK